MLEVGISFDKDLNCYGLFPFGKGLNYYGVFFFGMNYFHPL